MRRCCAARLSVCGWGARFKKIRHPFRVGPEVRFAYIHTNRTKWPVRLMCQVLGNLASGYFAWRGRLECRRVKANHALLADIRQVHAQSSGGYDALRVHVVLRRRGRPVGRSRIERLMHRTRRRGLKALPRFAPQSPRHSKECTHRKALHAPFLSTRLVQFYAAIWHNLPPPLTEGKVPAFGLPKRDGKVLAVMIPDTKSLTMIGIIRQRIKPNSIVYADSFGSYDILNVSEFHHLE